jgi:hypothetical protein
MRAILIDPFAEQVTTVECDGEIRSIYQLIGADTFDVVRVGGDDLFVDDEGLFQEKQRFFQIEGYPQPLAGKALVLGLDLPSGDSAEPNMSEGDVRALVTFLPEGYRYDPPPPLVVTF